MDSQEWYKAIIQQILAEHVTSTPKEESIETFAVCDDKGGHYMLVETGWQYPRRLYNVVFHIRLKDNKIWIEEDWTESGVARELLAAGVSKDTIELGFQPPEMRPYIEWGLITTK
ncbi:MAG: XisI protein [Caldilinea sp. CFX5]|nr:XisI protein [Caldilinea sp. CFX5]